MLPKVTQCTGYTLANTRPHQIHWGDQEHAGSERLVGRLHWMPDLENLIANNFTNCTALGAIRRVLLTSTITAWRSAIGVDICNSC